MPNQYDLTNKRPSETYQRVLQIIDGKYYNGLGEEVFIINNTPRNIDGGAPDTIYDAAAIDGGEV